MTRSSRRNTALCAVFVAAFVVVSCCVAQMPPSAGVGRVAPNVTLFVQPSSPVAVDAFSVDVNDSLLTGRVSNRTNSAVRSVRFGSFVIWSNARIERFLGPEAVIALKPNSGTKLPKQPLPGKYRSGAYRTVLFVAEVHFADGAEWKADLDKLQKEIARQFMPSIHPAKRALLSM